MSEEIMELEITEDLEEEEEEAPSTEVSGGEMEAAVPSGVKLNITLENPQISIEKLIIRKKE